MLSPRPHRHDGTPGAGRDPRPPVDSAPPRVAAALRGRTSMNRSVLMMVALAAVAAVASAAPPKAAPPKAAPAKAAPAMTPTVSVAGLRVVGIGYGEGGREAQAFNESSGVGL